MDKAVKHDQEKSRVDLLSSSWLMGVGVVLAYGAKKYAAHNWRKGLLLSRTLGATLRHVLAFLGGEDLDPETGLCHLLHASCSVMFAYETWLTSKGMDDRYVPKARVGVSSQSSEVAPDPAQLPLFRDSANFHLWDTGSLDVLERFVCGARAEIEGRKALQAPSVPAGADQSGERHTAPSSAQYLGQR